MLSSAHNIHKVVLEQNPNYTRLHYVENTRWWFLFSLYKKQLTPTPIISEMQNRYIYLFGAIIKIWSTLFDAIFFRLWVRFRTQQDDARLHQHTITRYCCQSVNLRYLLRCCNHDLVFGFRLSSISSEIFKQQLIRKQY